MVAVVAGLASFDRAWASTPPTGAVDNGDGTYSYPDPDSLQPGFLQVIGPVEYSFVGPVRYSYDPVQATPYVWSQPTGWVDYAPRAIILRGQHIDDLDREWLPVGVDDAALLTEVQAWETSRSIDWPPTTSLPTSDLVYEQGGSSQFEPEGHRTPTCTTGMHSPWPYTIFDVDSRTVTTSTNPATWNEWQRQTVAVSWTPVPTSAFKCTGSLITTNRVLTAAHCVWDMATNRPINPRDPARNAMVCSFGAINAASPTCRAITAIRPGPWGRWGFQPGDDYAILELGGHITGVGLMELSGDSRARITEDFMVHTRTYPLHRAVPFVNGNTAGCTDNGRNAVPLFAATGNPARESMALPTAVTRSTMRTRFDGSRGDSGAPWFRCHGATGSCETGETAFQTAVWAGYNPLTHSRYGPLVPTFRAWAITSIRTGAC